MAGAGGCSVWYKIGQRAELPLLHETLEFITYAVSQIDTIEVQATQESSLKESA